MRPTTPFLFALSLTFLVSCAAWTGTEDTDPPPDPFETVSTQNCTQCHDLARVEKARREKSPGEMQDTVERMQQKPGSGITDDAVNEMMRYY